MIEYNRKPVSSISYRLVERTIHWHEQKVTHYTCEIELFSDIISTATASFQLEHVLDMSYRPFSGGNGLFYLHTSQGVFTYEIHVDPSEFINAFKKLRD